MMSPSAEVTPFGGFAFGFQLSQRGGDPLGPAARVGQLSRHLIPAPARPEQLVLGGVGRGVRGGDLRGQPAQGVFGPVR
jgi:hypothetical protein